MNIKIIKIKCQVLWKVLFSNKFIFYDIKRNNPKYVDVFKTRIGFDTKQDAARFLRNEASKLTWGHIHTDTKNLKL